jgi:hypothetical protein
MPENTPIRKSVVPHSRRETEIERDTNMSFSLEKSGRRSTSIRIQPAPLLDAKRKVASLHLIGRSFAENAQVCKEL